MMTNKREAGLRSKLQGLYRALTTTCTDPILVHSSNQKINSDTKSPNKSKTSRVYFCTEDNGNKIVRERLNNYRPHIQRSYLIHKKMQNEIKKIGAGGDLKSNIEDLLISVNQYGNFVEDHNQIAEKPFLEFPFYKGGGHDTYEGMIVPILDFNPNKTQKGLESELQKMKKEISSDHTKNIQNIRLTVGEYEYSNKLKLVHSLIKDIFDIDLENELFG